MRTQTILWIGALTSVSVLQAHPKKLQAQGCRHEAF